MADSYRVDYHDDLGGFVVVGDLGGGFRVVYTMAPEGNEPVISQVRVLAPDGHPSGGLTARQLRRLRPGLAVEVFRDEMRYAMQNRDRDARMIRFFEMLSRAGGAENEWRQYVERARERVLPWRDVLARLDKIGKAPSGESRSHRLARVAGEYVLECDSSTSPVKTLAARLGITAPQVRDDLYAARQAGYLTETRQGKSGGELLPAGVDVLLGEGG